MKNTIEIIKNKITKYFNEINFNAEQHKYEVGGKPLTSVSNMIKKYVEPVDFDKIAGFVAKKRGVPKSVVLAEWAAKRDNSCIQGTSVHVFGEDYEKGRIPTNGYEQAIVKFWDSIPDYIVPVLFELKMFYLELGIAGTMDILLYNTKTDKFIIGDYKTNEDLYKNFKNKKLLKPFDNLLDSPFSKYEIQLSAYQIQFEQTGFEVESRRIIWLKPDGTFNNIKARDLTKEIKKELKNNKLC